MVECDLCHVVFEDNGENAGVIRKVVLHTIAAKVDGCKPYQYEEILCIFCRTLPTMRPLGKDSRGVWHYRLYDRVPKYWREQYPAWESKEREWIMKEER